MLGRLVKQLLGVEEQPEAEHYTVRGFSVFVQNTRPDIRTEDVLQRLDDALGLIERMQPWRFKHLQHDLREFWVARYPCRGAYFRNDRACMTELTFLNRRDIGPETVASSIVHEGMHARVHMMGVRPENADRAREERLCRRAELEFGQSLPAEISGPVVERALAALAASDADVAPEIDWREAQARTAAVDQAARRNI
jgi:hypothetical protein